MSNNNRPGGCAPADGRPAGAVATAATLAASLIVLTAVLGFFDGTGLGAPENWLDAGFVPTFATSPAWATVCYLPLLVAGSAAGLYLLVRAARPGVRAGWVLGAAWSTVLLTAFLAKLAYSLLLLAVAGPTGLHPAAVAGAVLAECGLTGAKYAILGFFAAAPAALAHVVAARKAPHALPPARTGAGQPGVLAISLLAGSVIAAAAAGGSFAWIEGSGRALILTAGGLAGSFAAAWLLGPRAAAGLAVRTGPAAWWAQATVTTAAGAIGFLLPFVISGVVSGFGGALFPAADAVFHLAAGVIAGVCGGVIGLAIAPLGARLRAAVGVGGAVITVTGFVLPGGPPPSFPVPHAASRDDSGLLALTVLRRPGEPPVIGDSLGRQVLLRGVNVNQLVDYGQPRPPEPAVRPLTNADYAAMASVYGFDVQRLNLSWSALEPERGVFSQSYLSRIRTAVNWAAGHGIYTVLDLHQDTYSKFVTAPPGTRCRLGATPEFGNDGAPRWATLTDGATACGFLSRDLSPNVEQSFTNLYDNTDGIGSQFAWLWGKLAQAFAADSAVAGYDLLNEPGPGDAPGFTSSLLLGRLYQQAITAIRAAETRAHGGYHHLVFFEPSILWSGLGFDVTPPAGFARDPGLVFSPHLYSQSITMDQALGLTLTTIEQGYATAERTAAGYGVPLWSGEWGWFGPAARVAARFDRFLNAQNAAQLGSAIWVWKKACGDPQSSPGDKVAGGINLYSCGTGRVVPSPAFQTAALAQAYPRAAPGRLLSLSSSPTGVDLRLSGLGTGLLDVWVPGPGRPAVTTASGLGELALREVPGGWRLTASAAGAYSLTIR